ncbi:TRAP transporter small permease [Oceanimonas doudoroffii]|uniref:TRAP transporter small permease protein n=1 Tax=Oceanimonas doudoroffii TaxID=84158 RepID=A0A233RII4_9GAMM|nr:TRAP transporter small permease subunit [Oceanimonas doudoroffii]OXY83200.1 hypothetical protein B6S08_06810 [Oceanimonas doudoroffii]
MDWLFRFTDKLIDILFKPLVVLIGLFIAVSFVIGIVSRALFGEGLFGLEELILLSVIWFYMLGASIASQERSHLQADFIPIIFKSEIVICSFQILSTIISIVMAFLFVNWSYDLVEWGVVKKQSTPVFSIPWYVSQASLLVASSLMVLYLLRDLFADIKNFLAIRKKSTTQVSVCKNGNF